MKINEQVEPKYKDRLNFAKDKITSYQKEVTLTSWLRVMVFGLFAFSVYFHFKAVTILGWVALIVEVAVFLYLLKKFVRAKAQLRYWKHVQDINEDELKCLDHQYNHFEDGEAFKDITHDYSFDLDLFGKASIFQFVNRTCTPMGKEKLFNSMSTIELDREQILDYQEAIKELTPLLEWRQEFLASGKIAEIDDEKLKGLISWIKFEDVFSKVKGLKIMLILSPIIFGLMTLGVSFELIPSAFFLMYIVLPLVFVGRFLKFTNREQNVLDTKLDFLKSLKNLLGLIEKSTFKSNYLKKIQSKLVDNEVSASESILILSKYVDMFLARNNIMVGILLNIAALWDLRYMKKIGVWRQLYGKHIVNWLDQVGELEKLICYANFAFNNPDYFYPSLAKNEEEIISAVGLGHPLLPYKQRVYNDYQLTLPKQFSIITGANMAGKSTFLRAVGVNYILALAGAPVCADQFRIKPMQLLTSMRTADSLYENKSYFHSELLRLKFILEKLKDKGEAFIILDEILKGTNFKDQSVGARALLDKLIGLNGRGIVATHDLSLCTIDKDYPLAVENLSFNVSFVESGLAFNYKLQNGICKQMNATYLMKNMGIIDPAFFEEAH